MMAEHLKYLEEAAKRDHRKIGKEQELFFFHECKTYSLSSQGLSLVSV